MRPSSTRRPLRHLALAAGVGLLLGACGGGATGTPAAAPTSQASSGSVESSDGGSPTSEDSGGGVPTDTALPGDSGAPGSQVKTAVLDMQVRVVNLWIPDGSKTGGAVDVWVGSPKYGGKKLQTVAYGKVSAFFAPEIPDPAGTGADGPHPSYSFGFYRAGGITDADLLINQGENASPGQKLTFVMLPTEPGNPGGSMTVQADDIGSAPAGGGWQKPSIPTPPSGKAILLMNATATEYLGRDPKVSTAYVPATTDGKCVQYLESGTGKIHDDPHSSDLLGGTSNLAYVVDPGAEVRFNVFDLKAQITMEQQCAGKAASAAFDPGLAAGGRAYGFLWGPDPAAPLVMILPVG